MSNSNYDTDLVTEIFTLNVTLLEPRMKHPTIFKEFDKMAGGEKFRILNDHDPRPLYYQLIAERGNSFTWDYITSGPEWWIVEIRKNDAGETIGELAAKDVRKAEVFKKYGIDFCCGGKRSLEEACKEKGLDKKQIENELNNPAPQVSSTMNVYDKWDPAFLADYIYNQHHLYYYEQAPVIKDLAEKILAHHGEKYPQLKELNATLKVLFAELNSHFVKEERVVFPFIKGLVAAEKEGGDLPVSQPPVTEAIHMMQSDHQVAGDLLARLRVVSDNYTVPEDACNSFRLLYQKLENLESDLVQHIHLENNILFPKAIAIEKKLSSVNSCQLNTVS